MSESLDWVADAGLGPEDICPLTAATSYSLPDSPVAPREARRHLAASLCLQHANETTADTAALLVSELVTNAIRYANEPIVMTVGCGQKWLVVAISDGSPELPASRTSGLFDEGGRGIQLVSTLAAGWGSVVRGQGKVTWFKLPL